MRSVGPNQYRSYSSHRRKKKNSFSSFVFFGVTLLLIYLIYILISSLIGSAGAKNITAELQILEGRAEFSLEKNDTWAPAYSDSKFVEGDSIRTSNNSKASLEILGGTILFLDANTEIQLTQLTEKSSDKKFITIDMKSGRIWTRVSEDFSNNKKSQFLLNTPQVDATLQGSMLDISTNGLSEDIIRVIKGTITMDLKQPDQKDTTRVKAGTGQKIVITPETILQIEQGADIIESIDQDFTESEWNIRNLERFSPQEASDIRLRIESEAAKQKAAEEAIASTEDFETNNAFPAPKIITPTPGEVISANADDVIILEGTTAPGTRQIIVNDFALSRFAEGDQKWKYFAAYKFGTLKNGTNTYSVYALNKEGEKSAPATITIEYQGALTDSETSDTTATNTSADEVTETQETEGTEAPTGFILPAPSISFPPILNFDTPYQTSSQIVTLSGNVDPRTEKVEVIHTYPGSNTVNEYVLKRFSPGDTEWSYIANAQYENMKEGENQYTINAYDANDNVSSLTIRIIYSPVTP